eukprot:15202517-Alexandrium_andersonii.AAC.1
MLALPPQDETACKPVRATLGDPKIIVPRHTPWLRCRAEKVPKWWCARCHKSAPARKALLKKRRAVGHAATDL